jgi:hypothetical protein
MQIINKLEIEIAYLENDEPFICGINGKTTIAMLQMIEKSLDESENLFDKGDGTYCFNVIYNNAETDDNGRVQIESYYELSLLKFTPIQFEVNVKKLKF